MLEHLLYWSPRVLSVLFAAFLSVFAFAAAADGHGTQATVVHFVTQLVPTLLVLAALGVAWRWPRAGAALFLAMSLAYVVVAWGRFPVSTYVVITAPMLLTAALFLAEWRHARTRGRHALPVRSSE